MQGERGWMVSLVFEVFSEGYERAQLGESPCWDRQTNDLWWVDITGKRLLRTNLTTGKTRTWETPELIGFVVLTGSRAPAVGMETGIFGFLPHSGSFDRLVRLDEGGHRFNDAIVDPAGRLWASTMALDARPGRGAIHLITENLSLQTVVHSLSIPNGLAVDLDRNRLFYSDSHPDVQSIWTRPAERDAGRTGEATLFARTTSLNGRPDGAALDQLGFYWIAGVDGSEIYVFDSSGDLFGTVPVPFPEPTKICFAGHDNRLLLVTSKASGESGGFLAAAQLPPGMSAGITQPYWNIGA